jgi:hypothetical protein
VKLDSVAIDSFYQEKILQHLLVSSLKKKDFDDANFFMIRRSTDIEKSAFHSKSYYSESRSAAEGLTSQNKRINNHNDNKNRNNNNRNNNNRYVKKLTSFKLSCIHATQQVNRPMPSEIRLSGK